GLRGLPFDLNSLAGVVATFALGAMLPWTLQWRRLDEMRRYFVTCIAATLLVFVTRPEGIIGGSIALAGGVVGILRRMGRGNLYRSFEASPDHGAGVGRRG